MSTIDRSTDTSASTRAVGAHVAERASTHHVWTARFLAAVRIVVGWTFLYAFWHKAFDSVGSSQNGPLPSWVDGGSPTRGFLGFAADGPFQDLYNRLAGVAWVDWAFMMALLLGGVALMLGVATRFASIGAAILLALMWTVVLPPANNPVFDEHVVQALAMLAVASYPAAHRFLGLQGLWDRLVADRFTWLR